MRLQPGLTQALTGTVRKRGNAVGGESEDRGDLVRIHSLHLGVPENRLPALGQSPECPHGEGAVECDGCRVFGGHRVFELADVIHVDITTVATPSTREIADRRVEIGAESAIGAAAGEDALVDAYVSLRHEVVGFDGRGVLSGHSQPGLSMTLPQLSEGTPIAGARQNHE